MGNDGERGPLLVSGLAPRDRRAILLGSLVLVPALLYVMAVRPYRAALTDLGERVEIERELLSRERDLLAAAAALPTEIQAAKIRAEGYEAGLLQAPTDVLAEAELTDFLESTAVRNRVLLEEIRGGGLARGEDPPPGLSVIRLHLKGESDLEGILTFLDEIEKASLLLRVRGLALEPQMARAGSNNQENPAQGLAPTGVVDLQIIVDGFSRISGHES